MLNAERYKDKILDNNKEYSGDVYSMFKAIDDIVKVNMSFNEALEWLLSEYEPTLLENGDGLKPGDWIMVRDSSVGEWVKKQFAYYYCGKFYCSMMDFQLYEGDCEGWKYARLPEEDELIN